MPDTNRTRISRRAFLRAAGIGAGGAALAHAAPLSAAAAFGGDGKADAEADVWVVGSGSAGFAAAIFAREAGASAVGILEKGAFAGGTTRKSGGVYWIPDNPVMRAHGIADPRDDALRYMARLAYPDLYSPEATHLGVGAPAYALLETYYDRGREVVERLQTLGVLESTFWPAWDGRPWTDYHADLPENRAPRGRGIVPKRADGSAGDGADLIRALQRASEARGIALHLRHAARRLVVDESGAVVGLEVATPGRTLRLRARRGVVFCTGGFAQNPRLVRSFLRGVAWGSCEVPTNEGDFVAIGGAVGARLANMKNAAWKQVVLEQVLAFPSIPNGVASIPGDSSLLVNRKGVRVVNEKLNYDQRAQVHFDWDASESLYGNEFLFMVYDHRTAELFAGVEPVPPRGAVAPEILSAPTLAALGPAIDARLAALEARIPRFRTAPGFARELERSVARFNGFARSGKDLDFQRGESTHEPDFHGPRREGNELPNPMLFPLSARGPYFAVILAAGTYGTRGGPEIDASARVLDAFGEPIAGLYGAGNCVASPAGGGYFGGGSQLGPGIVFGALAGEHAARRASGSA